MIGEELRNILKYTMKYADTTYARQCTCMYLLKTYCCEMCPLRTKGLHCYASEFIREEQEVLK